MWDNKGTNFDCSYVANLLSNEPADSNFWSKKLASSPPCGHSVYEIPNLFLFNKTDICSPVIIMLLTTFRKSSDVNEIRERCKGNIQNKLIRTGSSLLVSELKIKAARNDQQFAVQRWWKFLWSDKSAEIHELALTLSVTFSTIQYSRCRCWNHQFRFHRGLG